MPAAAVMGNLQLKPACLAGRGPAPKVSRMASRVASGRGARSADAGWRENDRKTLRSACGRPASRAADARCTTRRRVQLALDRSVRVRYDGQPAQTFLQRADATPDDGDAAMLAQRAVAWRPTCLAAAPLAEAWIVELRSAVTDDVLGSRANVLNRPAQEAAHGPGGWLAIERGGG